MNASPIPPAAPQPSPPPRNPATEGSVREHRPAGEQQECDSQATPREPGARAFCKHVWYADRVDHRFSIERRSGWARQGGLTAIHLPLQRLGRIMNG
jgi:hypothetical protein